jgi:hypothetical protein
VLANLKRFSLGCMASSMQPGKSLEREFITQQIGADSISKSHEIHAGYMQPLACSQLNLLKGYFSRKRYQIL